ncbi:hypothetical protein [Curtobacterium sp. Leaf261]|uniref:hypothetical protein n=1 Tax=Curtobacterium sp. Leaf261 TaxID=1736311 RepID=UPI0006FDBE00|nr:hypothetical protein [Curtobacterium sp. Leaf261]KQO63055.1 hypothetical protein ASF23_09285 [Curtobacterium sp. Leaf261]
MHSIRTLLALAASLLIGISATGCTASATTEDPSMHPTSSSAAKEAFLSLNAILEDTQDVIGGDWLNDDDVATECSQAGARWGLSRFGRGMTDDERRSVLDAVRQRWIEEGWTPTLTRTLLGSDSPGLQLRYPARLSVEGGLFVELVSTVHATTIFAQTRCAEGDVDALDASRWSERHTSTPPYFPVSAPTTPTPTMPAASDPAPETD